MKGDFSRITFDPRKHHSGVLMQQGRVQLDADWNEQEAIGRRRDEVAGRDVIGPCGAPQEDAGFAIAVAGNSLSIGAGRFYADGILTENEIDDLAYEAQPDLPDPPDWAAELSAAGTDLGLVYLDVWRRHVTALDDTRLREVALGGPDTATRLKTVWQVRVLPLAVPGSGSAPPGCGDAFPEWDALVADPDRRLNARSQPPSSVDGPCIVPPTAGFRRLENQLYRVEVHNPGPRASATFKWSRDNGTVVTRIEQISGADVIVHDLGPDDVLGFAAGQWVELTDEALELAGLAGQLVEIDGITEPNRITLKTAPTPLAATPDGVDPERHPKLRRWDQRAGTGLPSVSADGVAMSGGWLALEDGVEVQFSNSSFRTGDYWLIPARTATGELEWPPYEIPNTAPEAQLPNGIGHHYCRLALLAFDASSDEWSVLEDCRPLFPPLAALDALDYVAGDGQEVTPVPGSAALLPVPVDPTVGIARGPLPVSGRTVRFTLLDGVGAVAGSAGPAEVVSDVDGLAAVGWELDPTVAVQRLEAALLDDGGTPISLPVRFSARLRTADAVAYDPAACPSLAGNLTVQDAIDALCGSRGDDDGIHVTRLWLPATGDDLLNDQSIVVDELAKGIRLDLDRPIDPAAVTREPICFVTIEVPFPFAHHDQEFWGIPFDGQAPVIGFQPLVLAAETVGDGDSIAWFARPETLEWLRFLMAMMEELQRGDRVLARLTVQGSFVWSEEDPTVFLDGDTFGRPNIGWTDLVGRGEGLYPGDGRRGGDVRSWFWLARERRFRGELRLREELELGHFAVATLVLPEPAPEGGLEVRLRSDRPEALALPETVVVPAGATEVRFRVTATEGAEPAPATVALRVGDATFEHRLTLVPPHG